MKTIYLLFVIFTDAQGYESLRTVSNVEHKDRLSCLAEKAHHKGVKGIDGFNDIEFFCGESHLYFNKEQKLH